MQRIPLFAWDKVALSGFISKDEAIAFILRVEDIYLEARGQAAKPKLSLVEEKE